MNQSRIRLAGVSKHWGATTAVNDISFDIQPGQFVILLGPSGCGKSTTLRMLAGLDDASSGRIHIGERDVTHLPPGDRGLSMVFQSYALFPHLSVADNIVFGLRSRKVAKAERQQRLAQVAELVDLTDYLHRKPAQLSGGQRQRVALARAIISEHPICLMDEPLSNLDARLRSDMRREIKALQSRLDMTVVYVTHDQVEAMSMGDRVILMQQGHIVQDGTPDELYNQPASAFAASFIGSPAMNLLPGEIIATGEMTRVRLDSGLEAVAAILTRDSDLGLKVNLGVRPEDLRETEGDPLFTGTVDITEALGEVTLLYFEKDEAGRQMVAKLPGIRSGLRHSAVRLTAAPEALHLFHDGVSLLYR